MTDPSNKKLTILTAVVVLLLVAVVAQSVVILGLHRRMAPGAERGQTDRHVLIQDEGGESPSSTMRPASPFGADPFDWDLDDWDPFKEMHSMHDRINQMFGSAFNRFEQSDDFGDAFNQYAFSPDINIEDKGSHYLVTVDLPGLEDSELEINVNGQILTISGTTRSEKIDERDSRMLRQERRSGKFSRRVTLPGLVRADKMEANQDNGVLSIKLPKDD